MRDCLDKPQSVLSKETIEGKPFGGLSEMVPERPLSRAHVKATVHDDCDGHSAGPLCRP
jgi:hypothetical protein